MPNHRRFLSRRWLLGLLCAAALLFGVLMLHPYPRQSLFGPTIRGKPWCVWDAAVRRFSYQEEYNKSLPGRIQIWLGYSTGGISLEDLAHPEMLPLYTELLDDEGIELRRLVLGVISRHETLHHAEALPALRRRLDDHDSNLRMLAAKSIWLIGRDKSVTEVFFRELDNPESNVRKEAMRLLTSICAEDSALLAKILPFANDVDGHVRAEAMFAISSFGKAGVPTLIGGLNDPDFGVVWAAASALGQLGPDAVAAFPTLEHLACFRQFPPPGPCGTYSPRSAVVSAMSSIDPERYTRVRLKIALSRSPDRE